MADPAAPAPPTPPGGGPRRIRSLPDRPGKPRPAGGVRSIPDQAPASTRLPGTDAASYGGDVNWRRGVAILWVLFGLIAVGEAFELLVHQATGGSQWSELPTVCRLLIVGSGFLALWFGWSWTRWALAAVAFFVGGATLLLSFRADYHGLNPDSAAQGFGVLFHLGAIIALGAAYLILAAFLIFSVDLLAFVQHRWESGRGWVAAPVGLLVAGYCAAMGGAPFVLHRELESTRPAMLRLARHDAEVMAAHWDPESIPTFLDAKALESWPDAGRQNLMNLLRPLGTYLGPGEEGSGVFFDPTRIGASDCIRGTCQEAVRCTEGRTVFYFALARPLFGPWRVVDFSMRNRQFYNPPKPAANPAATPVPSTGG